MNNLVDDISRHLAVIKVVGQIDGHDVIRRSSVFDNLRSHKPESVDANKDAERQLGNLLATIFRDGGHVQSMVGTPAAVALAMQQIHDWIRATTPAPARCASGSACQACQQEGKEVAGE